MWRARHLASLPPDRAVDALAGNGDFALGGLIQAGNQIEERGFARARGSHERQKFALFNREIHAVQHLDGLLAALVALHDVLQMKPGCSSVRSLLFFDANAGAIAQFAQVSERHGVARLESRETI